MRDVGLRIELERVLGRRHGFRKASETVADRRDVRVAAPLRLNERALQDFKRANQIQPQRRGYANIATISYRLGRFSEAVAAESGWHA